MEIKLIIYIIIFIAFHLGLFVYGYYKQKYDPELQVLDRIGESVLLARAAGLVLALDMSILLFPVCRNIIRIIRTTFLNKIIPFDEHILFHKMTAYSLLIFTIIHVNGHYTNMFKLQTLNSALTPLYLHYRSYAGVSGHLMLLIMFMMFTAAALKVRKMKFEVFWFVHHLYIPFYVAYFVHALGCMMKSSVDGQCKGYYSRYYMLPGLIAFIIERIIREWRARQETAITKVNFHPGNTMEIRFEKPSFMYKPGQYLFLNVPEISYFQWHPFTISSCIEEGYVTVHIRCVGDWTKALEARIKSMKSSNLNFPRLMVDGPFGAPAEDLFQYEVATLVSAGIGVTPAASLLKSVWYKYQRKAPMKLRKLHFIWVNRDKQDFSWFQGLLATLEKTIPNDFLEIHIYLTGKLPIEDIKNLVYNTTKKGNDPLTALSTKTNYGRPIWPKVFNSLKKEAGKENRNGHLKIGIFFCGPAPLGETLVKSSHSSSDKNITFVPHLEHF